VAASALDSGIGPWLQQLQWAWGGPACIGRWATRAVTRSSVFRAHIHFLKVDLPHYRETTSENLRRICSSQLRDLRSLRFVGKHQAEAAGGRVVALAV